MDSTYVISDMDPDDLRGERLLAIGSAARGATMVGLAGDNELRLVFRARRAEAENEVIRALTAVAGASWNQRYRVDDGRNR
jgi:hypothetical protein